MPFGAPAPVVIILTMFLFITAAALSVRVYADEKKVPARDRKSGQQKAADRGGASQREGSTDQQSRKDGRRNVDKREKTPAAPEKKGDKLIRKKDPGEIIGGSRDTGGSFGRRPPRETKKDPPPDTGEKGKKEKGPVGRPPFNDIDPVVVPGIGGGYVPPRVPPRIPGWHPGWDRRPHRRPRPPVIYNTYIYNYIVLEPIPPDLIDDEMYGIRLPFGPVLPWEVGELFLMRLKYLEDEGLGETMLTAIVQTRDEMGWERFLDIYGGRLTDVVYYGPVGRTSFLVSMTVSDILDLMVLDGIRWIGEFYPEYKIVPGGRNSKFYVLSLEGDTIGFRRELRDAGVFVMGYDPETAEYYVRSSEDTYDAIASLWWVGRISGTGGEPFFQPGYEWVDVGMAE
jgi:hypothetical protein